MKTTSHAHTQMVSKTSTFFYYEWFIDDDDDDDFDEISCLFIVWCFVVVDYDDVIAAGGVSASLSFSWNEMKTIFKKIMLFEAF